MNIVAEVKRLTEEREAAMNQREAARDQREADRDAKSARAAKSQRNVTIITVLIALSSTFASWYAIFHARDATPSPPQQVDVQKTTPLAIEPPVAIEPPAQTATPEPEPAKTAVRTK